MLVVDPKSRILLEDVIDLLNQIEVDNLSEKNLSYVKRIQN